MKQRLPSAFLYIRSCLALSALLLFHTFIFGQATITVSNDTTICMGGTAPLTAVVTGGSYGTNSYTFETFPYAPEPFTGGIAVCNSFTICQSTAGGKDDCIAGPFDIGFSFCFFNQNYTQFWIGSNGWISFSAPPGDAWVTYIATTIPNASPSVPKNAIFFPWEDWLPCKNVSNVFYYNSGSAPNRKLVVYWYNSPFFGCSGLWGTFQVVLNETTSVIENHIQSKPQCGAEGATQGVQNSTGTVAFTATGRNDTQWTATNESTRFVPSGITWYTGGYPGGTIVGYGSPISFSPVVTTTYTAVITTCDASVARDSVKVTVIDPSFTYLATSYCQSDPDPTPTAMSSGGTFSAFPAGLVFSNTTTGTVDLSASSPGVYNITHTVGGCTAIGGSTLTVVGTPPPPTPLASYVSRCGPGFVTFGVIQPPGMTIKWYDAPAGGNLLFTGSSVTTNVTVTTHYYAEAVTTATSCTSLSRTNILVAIRSIPVITNPVLNYTICSRDSIKITLQSSVLNSSYSWRAYSNSPTLSGYSNASGPVIAQKLINSGSTNDTVTYAVAAFGDTCTSDTVRFTVKVNPLFDVSASPATQTICSTSFCSIDLNSSLPTTTFTWTATASSPDVTGYSNGAGNIISQPLINVGPVNHDVTYKVVAHGLGCIGDTATSVVTVLPYPDLSNNPKNKSICSNTATAITLTSSIPGTQFTWTTTPSSANVTGYSNNPVNTVSLNQTLVNTGFATENVIYHLTPHHNSCDGLQTDFTVYVYPVTNILFVPPSQAICSGQQCTINLNSNVAGTTFSWTAFGSSPGITGYSANSGSLIQQPLQNSIYVPGTVTYVVTSSANGCTGRTDSVIVTVKPVPAVSLISCNDTITTTTAQPFKLKGGNPPGGIFSGAGVNSLTGFFSPSLAGTGNHPVTYTYTNTYACSDLAVLTLHVQTPANFICGNSLTDIRDNWAYPTISIGSQCWMAANLNFGSRIISTQVQRDNCQVEKYCFGDINANCVLYGGLYQWDEMMQYQDVPGIQGFCPPGWHVPSEAEWNILFSNYVNNGFAAAALKSSGYSGFNASLFGTEYFNRSSNFFNFATMIWSSTSHGPVKAWAHGMNDPDPSASYYPGSRANAFQVRCLKD